MPDNVYKVIELVGTSEESWEKAAKAAVERAAQSLRDLRVAEVVEQDLGDRKGQSRSLSHQGEGFIQVRRQRLTLAAGDDKQDVEAPSWGGTIPPLRIWRDKYEQGRVAGPVLTLAGRSIVHPAHAAAPRHCWGSILLRRLSHHGLGGDHEAGDRSRVL
jgi:flavin-binding protein dodecin